MNDPPMTDTPSIFICYRRSDTADAADRIFEQLETEFGRKAIFMDVEAMPLGADFREHVAKIIDTVDVFLAFIGPNWLQTYPGQKSRLWEDDDLVRTEIESAIASEGIVLLPTLVSGGEMPAADELPPSIRKLVTLNAARVRRGSDFRKDMRGLIDFLRATPRRRPRVVGPVVAPPPSTRVAVVGIGGAGSNAINNIINANLETVEYFAFNTDKNSLEKSRAANILQLGPTTTNGLGAGAQPEVGALAARESQMEIARRLDGFGIVVLTAGLGGGTGTGAMPVIAEIARQQGAVVVAVASTPFNFEGQRRAQLAQAALSTLGGQVDALAVIENQNLFRVANNNTTFAEAFQIGDFILYAIVRAILDVAVSPGLIRVPFSELVAALRGFGKAKVGFGDIDGSGTYLEAINQAFLFGPMHEAGVAHTTRLIASIRGGDHLTLGDIERIRGEIRARIGPEAHILLGSSYDPKIGEKTQISIWANGA